MQPKGELVAHDGTRLALYHQPVDGTVGAGARAAVALVHGLGEHAGRHAHVVAALARAGYETFAFDLRGHGRSPGGRGRAPSISVLLADIDALIAHARGSLPNLPLVLYGHSLGGLLVLAWALREPVDGTAAGDATTDGPVAALVSTSPALAPAQPPPRWKVLAASTLGRLFPRLTLRTGLDSAGLSRDPAVRAAYLADPLVHDRIGARLALEVLQLGYALLERAPRLSLPALLLHGTADRLTSFEASRRFAEAAPTCRLVAWPGGLHELHNEPEREEVLAKITGWLEHVL